MVFFEIPQDFLEWYSKLSLNFKVNFTPYLKLQWNYAVNEKLLPVINDCYIGSRNPQKKTTPFQFFLANLSLIVIISWK